jgi:hypothetical protein
MFSKKKLVWSIFFLSVIFVALSCRIRVDESTLKAADDPTKEVYCWVSSSNKLSRDYQKSALNYVMTAPGKYGLKNISAPSIDTLIDGQGVMYTLCVTADKKEQ